MVVDSCSSHSSLNPLGLIEILFEIGIFFTGLAFLVAIWTAIRYSRKKAALNCVISVAALAFLGLATILTHGLAVAVSKLLNLLGSGIGLRTTYGGKFIALAWATVILLIVNIGLWTIIVLFLGNLPGGEGLRRGASSSGSKRDPEKSHHNNISGPVPSYSGEYVNGHR